MPTDEDRARFTALGLCATCLHRREQSSRRGSTFHRCGRADADERFPRYPALPVLACPGHEPDRPKTTS